MEHKCKRLHQMLESLLSDSELRSWTVHNNKNGSVITIRLKNMDSLEGVHHSSSTTDATRVTNMDTGTPLLKPVDHLVRENEVVPSTRHVSSNLPLIIQSSEIGRE